MAQPSGVHQYKEEKTQKGAMKIEVVMEPQKKPKRDRPGSASSIRNMEEIERRQKVMSSSCNISISSSCFQKCNITHSDATSTAFFNKAVRESSLLMLYLTVKYCAGCGGEAAAAGERAAGEPHREAEEGGGGAGQEGEPAQPRPVAVSCVWTEIREIPSPINIYTIL